MLNSQWNDGYRADSGPSKGVSCRRAFRPLEASEAADRYVRFTSTPAIRLIALGGSLSDRCGGLLLSFVQVTARLRSSDVDLRLPSQPEGAPITATLALFSRGIPSRAYNDPERPSRSVLCTARCAPDCGRRRNTPLRQWGRLECLNRAERRRSSLRCASVGTMPVKGGQLMDRPGASLSTAVGALDFSSQRSLRRSSGRR